LDDNKEITGYCKLKLKALDSTVWETHLRRGYGPVVRQVKE